MRVTLHCSACGHVVSGKTTKAAIEGLQDHWVWKRERLDWERTHDGSE